jgi:hypothetical protein
MDPLLILTVVGICIGIIVGVTQLGDWFHSRLERRRLDAITTKPAAWADESEDWRSELLSSGVLTDSARQQERIHAVLGSATNSDGEQAFAAWYKYLRRTLVFPFEVTRRGQGDQSPTALTARRLIGVRGDEIIAQVAAGAVVVELPLEALVSQDSGSRNHECLEDYARWRQDRA